MRREEQAGSVVLLLDSPAKRNALSRQMVGELREHLSAAATDPTVRAVALTATGGTFCAGADLDDPPVQQGPGSLGDVLLTLWEYPKPVVAAINGHVRAGGLGLIAAADVAVSVEPATFAFTEVRLGLVPALISVLCLRKMAPTAASRYLLTGERFSTEDAVSAGLISSVVPDGTLAVALDELLHQFRQCEPEALRVTKELIRRWPQVDVATGLEQAAGVSAPFFDSEAGAEGIAAFRQRRPPRWAVE